MKMEMTERSEMSAYKIQTPLNYPEESTQHSEHGESLKSRINKLHYSELYLISNLIKNCGVVKIFHLISRSLY